jgi:hypothetical protein
MGRFRKSRGNDAMSVRAACGSGPAAGKSECINKLARYSSVDPKCTQLSGSALDDCLKGAHHGQ